MESLAEVRGLQEDNMDLMKKAVSGAMQTLKMKDGKLKMDKVTASAIMQIFDKLNPANQKKMEKMINDGKKSGIIKLSDFAMSKVTGFKREDIDLDEGKERGPRQLVNPNKEVMVVKKNKVVVIDKKDEDKYLKQGWSLAEETEIDEGKIAGSIRWVRKWKESGLSKKEAHKRAKEMDIHPKVVDDLYQKEEVDLDEAPKYELYHKDFSSAMQHAYKMAKKLHGITVKPSEIDDKVASGPKKPSEGKTNSYRLEGDKGAIQVQVYNKGGSKPYELNFYKEEVELDEKVEYVEYKFKNKNEAMKAKAYLDKQQRMSFDINDDDIANGELYVDSGNQDMTEHHQEIVKMFKPKILAREKNELDEGSAQVLAHGGKGQFKVVRNKEGVIDVMYKGKVISSGDYDRGAGSFFMNIAGEKGQKSFDSADDIADWFGKNPKAAIAGLRAQDKLKIGERVAEQLSKIKGNTPADQGRRGAVEDDIERAKKKGDKKLVAKLKEAEPDSGADRIRAYNLDEGKMKELHGYIEDGKSAEWIAKKMGVDVKTIKSLMSGYKEAYELGTNEYRAYLEKVTPGEVDEASARADAARAMRADPSMSSDPFSKDVEASPEDVKGAEKNIINQLRGLVSLRGIGKVQLTPQQKRNLKKKDSKYLKTLGSGFVQFGKGQEKVDIKVAQAVLNKFNSIKKPADKEKFQAQVGKSYKDMLKVLKAGYNEEAELDEAKKPGLKLQCQECGKVFTKKISPKTVEVQCPKCKGFDVDIAEEVEVDEALPGKWPAPGVKKGTRKDLEKLEKELQAAKKKKDKEKAAALQKELEALLKSGKGKKIGPAWMHKEETILDRIDRKLKEKKEILEASNRWELAGKKFSLINDKGTFILVKQGTGEEKKLKAKTSQDATQELVKKGYRES